MKMTIGERVIEAKIKKRDEARREYEQALSDGKTASFWNSSGRTFSR